MIAKLENRPFKDSTLLKKIDYHDKKIKANKAEVLFLPILTDNLFDFQKDCIFLSQTNTRVKLPYNEVSLNLPLGENLSNEKFLDIAHEYMDKLGYKDSIYSIIRHDDKSNHHVHIVFTTIDTNGKKINDSNIRYRSEKISRQLEKKYNFEEIKVKNNKSVNFGEIKAREYYVDKALKNALKSYSSNEKLNDILEDRQLNIITQNSLSNQEIKNILGVDLYDDLLKFLSDNNHFKPLYKEELLTVLDNAYINSNSKAEFIDKLDKENIYIRMVTDKGSHTYIYGLKDISIYFKDKQLPPKYRYAYLNDSFNQKVKENTIPGNKESLNTTLDNSMMISEQKNTIYTIMFTSLSEVDNIEDLQALLKTKGIDMNILSNSKGMYGITLNLSDISNPHIFKASEISRRLTYNNINNLYTQNDKEASINNPIKVVIQNSSVMNQLNNEAFNVLRTAGYIGLLHSVSNTDDKDQVEDFLSAKKKNRKKNQQKRKED